MCVNGCHFGDQSLCKHYRNLLGWVALCVENFDSALEFFILVIAMNGFVKMKFMNIFLWTS